MIYRCQRHLHCCLSPAAILEVELSFHRYEQTLDPTRVLPLVGPAASVLEGQREVRTDPIYESWQSMIKPIDLIANLFDKLAGIFEAGQLKDDQLVDRKVITVCCLAFRKEACG